jgi:hypothetical protein
LDYVAAEAIAHDARGIVWFTYWTPNPTEAIYHWKGGAIEYDGTPSPRADTLAAVNARARALAAAFRRQGNPARVAHFGSPMPRGSFVRADRIPGLRGVDGGPATVASHGGSWLVINRDRTHARTLTLFLKPAVGVVSVTEPDSTHASPVDPARRSVVLALEPGGSVVLGIAPR